MGCFEILGAVSLTSGNSLLPAVQYSTLASDSVECYLGCSHVLQRNVFQLVREAHLRWLRTLTTTSCPRRVCCVATYVQAQTKCVSPRSQDVVSDGSGASWLHASYDERGLQSVWMCFRGKTTRMVCLHRRVDANLDLEVLTGMSTHFQCACHCCHNSTHFIFLRPRRTMRQSLQLPTIP
ncbi:hypothetical protein BC835DRAFT_252313 [Cytidiella melzeri]|nr:hypothetical protein BC835DRAFT_252313 [Cytidiella melzeri]